jgi:hypothetical protein
MSKKQIPGMGKMKYEERLEILGLTTLLDGRFAL